MQSAAHCCSTMQRSLGRRSAEGHRAATSIVEVKAWKEPFENMEGLNNGDAALIATSCALSLLMTPGLALFSSSPWA